MIPPDLPFWTQLFTRLAVEAACVVTTAWLFDRLVRPAFWRRSLWQGAVICLLLLTGSELSGFGRGMTSYLFNHPRPEPKPIVLTLPMERSPLPPPSTLSLPLSIAPLPITVPSVEVEPEIIRPVWWPGLLWLAGGLLILGRVAAAQILFISMRRRRLHPACDDLRHRVAAILQRLAVRRKISLLKSGGLTTPIAFGVLRPSVVLPVDFEKKFTRAEQDAMLAHELAHLAARDPFWYLLADVSSAALWWHPPTWWARRRLHRASELAADEAAAIFPQGPAALAECLVTLGRQMTRLPRGSGIGVEGVDFRSNLAERVQRLLRLADTAPQPTCGWRIHAAKFSAILAVSTAALTLSGCLQNRVAVPPPTLQANLSQSWNTSPAATLWHSVLPPKSPEKSPAPELVKVQLVKPEEPVVDKTDQVASPVVTTKATIYSETIRVLESRRIQAQLDYNDHSNTLSTLHNLQAQGKLDQGIAKVERIQVDQDLIALSERVSIAQDNLTHVREGYGPESDPYVSAFNAYSEATKAYHAKVMATLAGWESVVDHDKTLLAFISDQEAQLTEEARSEEAARSMQATNDARTSEPAATNQESRQPNAYANTNIVYTSAGRQAILAKLQTIRLSELDFGEGGLPLNEVQRVLKDESRKRDLEGKGINFTYNSHPGDNPPTGSTPVDAKDITIRISPALEDLSLMDALDAICQVAELPSGTNEGRLAYTIGDYAVWFYIRPAQAVPLYTRTFHVDPKTFVQALAQVGLATYAGAVNSTDGGAAAASSGTFNYQIPGGAGGGSAGGMGGGLGEGGGGGENSNKPHPIPIPLYSPGGSAGGVAGGRSGGGGTAGGSLQYVIPQANTGSNSALVRNFFSAVGINLATNSGTFVFFNDRAGTILARATAEDLDNIAQAIELLHAAPPEVTIDVKFARITEANYKSLGLELPKPNPSNTNNSVPTNRNINGLRSTTPFSIVGVLHEPQFHKMIDAINQIDGSDLLSSPRVTTESARQAHFAVTGAPFLLESAVDILPTVSANGYLIEAVIIPTFPEFAGYDNPAFVAIPIPNATLVRGSSNGVPTTANLPPPHYRLRQSVISTNIFDGDTLVLCASLPKDASDQQKNELIFVTPRTIDPANNPLHTDEQLRLMEAPPKPESNVPK